MRDDDTCVIFALNGTRHVTRPRCSIVIPVHDRAGLTRQCLDAILAEPPATAFEIDRRRRRLDGRRRPRCSARYGDAVRVVAPRRERRLRRGLQRRRGGRARRVPRLPQQRHDPGGRLARRARRGTPTAIPGPRSSGSKLLFPNDTVQHAGVVDLPGRAPATHLCGLPGGPPGRQQVAPLPGRDGRLHARAPRRIRARRRLRRRVPQLPRGRRPLPADRRRSVTRSTTAPTSVVYHLESASRGRRSQEIQLQRAAVSGALGRTRSSATTCAITSKTGCCASATGISIRSGSSSRPSSRWRPASEPGSFIETQSRQVADLLRETVRLTAHVADIELGETPGGHAPLDRSAAAKPAAEGFESLLADADRLQLDIHAFQARIAETLAVPRGRSRCQRTAVRARRATRLSRSQGAHEARGRSHDPAR